MRFVVGVGCPWTCQRPPVDSATFCGIPQAGSSLPVTGVLYLLAFSGGGGGGLLLATPLLWWASRYE